MADLTARPEVNDALQAMARLHSGVRDKLTDELDDLGERVELVFAAFAPAQTGRLGRGVVATRAGYVLVVRSTARDPSSGYAYTAVTRFGHRAAWIYPRKAKALRFRIGGRTVFASRVRGYRPRSDWARDALPAIDQAAQQAAVRLGRTLEAVIA
jgi:hypothetical protein